MKKKIVILGAGISGLTTGWLLRKKYLNAVDILILEKSTSTGGMIQSKITDQFVLETGPNAFLTKGQGMKTLALIKEIGLSDQLLPSSLSARQRYLYYNNKIRKFGLPLLVQAGLVSSILKDLFYKKKKQKDETLKNFLSDHFSTKFIDNILSPFITAVKAGDIQTLSSLSTFPLLKHWESLYGSLILGGLCNVRRLKTKNTPSLPYLFSLKQGMVSLTNRLSLELRDCLKFDFNTTKVAPETSGGFLITSLTEKIKADFIISCIPLQEVKSIFNHPFIERLVTHTSDFYLTCVAMGWKIPPFFKKQGYGMLVNSDPSILGFLWNSDIFPEKSPGTRQISVLMSGKQSPGKAFHGLAHYLNISEHPDEVALSNVPYGIPQRKAGFNDLFLQASDHLPKNLMLSGQSISGPGINSCIAHAYEVVDNFSLN